MPSVFIAPPEAPAQLGFQLDNGRMRPVGFQSQAIPGPAWNLTVGEDSRPRSERCFYGAMVCRVALAPMAFHEDPSAFLVNPVMRDPAAVWLRRLFPPSRGPDVGVAVPTLVPGNPDVATAGR